MKKRAARVAKANPPVARVKSAARAVFSFGNGQAQGRGDMKAALGGKGANLAEMTRLGVPVPPGFTISTDVCAAFNAAGGRLPEAVKREALEALAKVERFVEKRFGVPENPLLVSVRSGARASMPGMMDTILNLGLNDVTAEGLAAQAGARFAYDSYRRFISMYGDVVEGVPRERFEMRLDETKERRGVIQDTELPAEDLRQLARDYLEIVRESTGREFPQDPHEQLWGAVAAVFRSWQNDRARKYRDIHDIPEAWGTAVNVQAMVFGNMGDDCATGVAFTRNPSTGDRVFYGEYLKNAQGEDVVAGIRTPQPINKQSRTSESDHLPTLEKEMPRAYKELMRVQQRLEKHYREMQDIEFTIERGKLWMLQTRTGKRTVRAAVKIAVDMAKEGLISREVAVTRVAPESLEKLLHPTLDPNATKELIAKGLPASPGAAVGRIVLSADEAEAHAKAGEKVVLVRIETSPDDIHGMHAAEGILTARGGMTSHAAVVARGMGKCCVAGCGALRVDAALREVRVGGHVLQAGDWITLDGATGEVFRGQVPTVTPELGGSFSDLMRWADAIRVVKVRTNADTPADAKLAREFGAEGIGLCRTEHMFFEPNRILAVREMILAADLPARERALAKLLPMQRGDFVGIFRAMSGLPVTIRLLDPPLHEFLPHTDAEIHEVAEALGSDAAAVRAKVEELSEFNPMLGHRGCRLGISFPEIYRMQVRAIIEAACEVAADRTRVQPEIMLPLIAHRGELALLRKLIEDETAAVLREWPRAKVKPAIGTMIEVPRAALIADQLAQLADFFSFGTNDLTQTGYALSRDDAGKFLPDYVDRGILTDDPFVSVDEEGIGALMRIGCEKGRKVRPNLKVGICGEHGGDPKSVRFCAQLGFDYVSCSPFRVPVARLAAAQAAAEQIALRRAKRA
jgi:pyruvate,orthophosphate dikinase